MRELLLNNKDILIRIEQIEKKMLKQGSKMKKHDEDIQMIFEALKQLLDPPHEPRPGIGYRRNNDKD
jgi:hypothetical protein